MAEKKNRLALHWQILIALVLATIIGYAATPETTILGIKLYDVFDFIGQLFLNALKMLIVPLIASSMIVGVSGIGASADLGRLGLRTLSFYAVTTTLAIILGLSLITIVRPGIVAGEPAAELLALEAETSEVAAVVGDRGAGDIVEIFLRMFPPNVIQAATDNGQILGIIVFSLLFGFFLSRIREDLRTPVQKFWEGVFEIMMRMTQLVMAFAPIGVFGLVAKVVMTAGLAAAQPLIVFALVVLAALTLHALVTLPFLIWLVLRRSPWGIYPAMAPAILTAFSTASSSATLPVNMECLEENVGVSPRITSFVLPLGATINMNGTALYECAAALFIAQAYGLDLSFGTQFSIVVLALVTSIGVAGIPAASLVAIAVILTAIGLPAEAIGVLFVFDRILDMFRTSVNVFGDAVCATIIAHLEGERVLVKGEPPFKGV
ncbi:MAG TPA: dicarboxylate/amino acid:cation symporter [Steroidobacteraceae bacterium]|nr:dicarboxylate/amino acid:cation symporter [Steroidobacteraceae bacterium]